MASPEELTHDGMNGILQPVLYHRWMLDTNLPEDLNTLLVRQALRYSINLVKRTFHVEFEQPIAHANTMFHAIELLTKGTVSFTVRVGNPGDEYDMVGITAQVIDHKYEQDYTGPAEVSMHKLEFKF